MYEGKKTSFQSEPEVVSVGTPTTCAATTEAKLERLRYEILRGSYYIHTEALANAMLSFLNKQHGTTARTDAGAVGCGLDDWSQPC